MKTQKTNSLINENKTIIITSFLLILLPTIISVIVWKKIPARLPIHFNIRGEADNWAGKGFVFFVIPLTMALLQSVCLFRTSIEKRQHNINPTALKVCFLIIPAILSLFYVATFLYIRKKDFNMVFFVCLFLGVLFILMGNFLPKTKQNTSFGVRTPWTLSNKDNWFHTHRFSGYTFIFCGMGFIVSGFVNPYIMFAFIPVAVFMPLIYSYWYYKTH